MGAETHWVFVLSAYGVALGLPALLGVWIWKRGRQAAKALATLVAQDGDEPPMRPTPSRLARVRDGHTGEHVRV